MENSPRVQKFGGPWSLIKTDMVGQYIRFFNTALKSKPFERVYIDAFAGSGAFRFVEEGPKVSIFGPVDDSQFIHEGSAQIALRASPPFHRIRFIEKDESNVEALVQIIKGSKHPDAKVIRGDANEELTKICRPANWSKRRGVIFLDPFGMNVEWATLELIARTRALDLWFLFALAGTVRNLPRNADQLDTGKHAAVTRILGTTEWYDEFYKAAEWRPVNIFTGQPMPPIIRRTATIDDIEAYVRKRLLTIFPLVEKPKRLRGPGNKSLFSLFFAVSNSSQAAINLAQKGASHILKNA
jgi:three-Cys-motif partner protein